MGAKNTNDFLLVEQKHNEIKIAIRSYAGFMFDFLGLVEMWTGRDIQALYPFQET